MIKRFYAENFSSIKDRIDVSFEATKLDDDTPYHNVFDYRDMQILKVSAFYGMNASGKSTIIRALAAVRELIVPVQPNLPLLYRPFEFSKKNKMSPIKLGIDFSTKNDGPLYRYSVSYDAASILEEKLEKLMTQKPTLLYERRTIHGLTNITLGQTINNNVLLQEIAKTVVVNKTFLSAVAQFNVEDFRVIYNFFLGSFINISPEVTRFDDILPTSIKTNNDLKDFTIKLLKAADFNISDLHIEKKNIKNQIIGVPFAVEAEREALFFEHVGKDNCGSIEFVDESVGTKKIVVLALHLFEALSRPSVLIVDELESSLHPELTKLIIKCFLDETINPHNSQLVFTSHQTTLLNLNLLRRDQINFVYKDEKTCGTYIRSLKEFHVRKTDSVEKSYLAGRYMTSPEVKEQLLEGAVTK